MKYTVTYQSLFYTIPILIVLITLFNNSEIYAADVEQLRCEHRENPLGIDVPRPKFSWIIRSNQRADMQSAYQVLVASDPVLLAKNGGDLWNSGMVLSDKSINVEYEGSPLRSFTQYYWKVRIWDKNRNSSHWSRPATWAMGVLNSSEWTAKWIGSEKEYPTLILRRDINVKYGLRRAIVAVSGLGQYEMTLNGNKVSDDVLAPGWTRYDKSVLYDMYDITSYLKSGDNAIGFFLGNGMYNVKGGRYAKFQGSFGPQKVIAQLCLEYKDGSAETIITDENWSVFPGPVTFSCVYGGEDYDANLYQQGWNQPGFRATNWTPAMVMNGPGGILKGSSCSAPPVRLYDTFEPVKVIHIRPGVTIYDFGQNAAQIPQITVCGTSRSSIKILPSEILRKDNSIDQTSIGGVISCTYKLNGKGKETWHPRFFYVGYRYLQVECIPSTEGGSMPVVESLESRVIHTSSKSAGEFETSNDLINRIFSMIRWAQRSNMVSIMTDCPHREKLGWLEQTYLNGFALRYNYDLTVFFNKLMNDMVDSQLDNGMVPDIAPEYPVFHNDFRDSPEWGSAIIQVPWHQYQFSGDMNLIGKYYNNMVQYLSYLESKAENHILSYGLGDWRQLEQTPKAVTATLMFYHDALILSKIANVLGKNSDMIRYQKLAEDIRDTFNRKFFNPLQHQYATGSQTSNSMSLVIGSVPEEQRKMVFDDLVGQVQANGFKTGEIGFPYLLRALAQGSRNDLIYNLITRTDKPGYGFQLNYGATSLPEDWDYQPSSSQNHFMLGHIIEWFYHDLAGIQCDPNAVGFKKIVIKPAPVGNLKWVRANYVSPYGRIVSNWKRDGKKFAISIDIPANTTATVYLPAQNITSITEGGQPVSKIKNIRFLFMTDGLAAFAIGSGSYEFAISLSNEYETSYKLHTTLCY